jgi:acyl-CoA thioester hydrolase
MGHVNHAVFLTFLEQCRLVCWRQLTGAPSPHSRVIVARAEVDYRAPAHFGDELEVRMTVGDIGRSSFALLYEVVDAHSGRTLASAKTVMVTYDYEAGRSVPIPARTRELLDEMKAEP